MTNSGSESSSGPGEDAGLRQRRYNFTLDRVLERDPTSQRKSSDLSDDPVDQDPAADQDGGVSVTRHASRTLWRTWAEQPLALVLHLLLVPALMTYCIPQANIFPKGAKWQAFPLLALAHGALKVLRVALRCVAFVVCMLRCVWRQSSREQLKGNAGQIVVEMAFATIWPTEGIASIAFISFLFSRTFTMPWLLMDVVVGETDYQHPCGCLTLAQGLFMRSCWIVGFVLGFRYFRELETRNSPVSAAPKDSLHLHPRMRKMIQSDSMRNHAYFAVLTWLILSVLECSLMYRWEAGVEASGSQELDAFRYPGNFFQKYHPDFTQWRFARVVNGNWRESFYFMMIFPRSTFLFAAVTALIITSSRLPRFSTGPWPWLRVFACEALLGIMSFIFCLSARKLQFFILCVLVSWECYNLEQKCEVFQNSFGALSSEQRVRMHQGLGSEVQEMGKRLHPIILFLILERALQMSFDVAQLRCEATPFTLVHYAFRHLFRTLGILVVIWRIGRLNASIYDDLTGRVQFLLASCHEREWASSDELQRHRRELKDWIGYLQHNCHGCRRYCLRVCGFQCCLRPHTAAGWAVTLALLPAGQKILGLLPGL